MAEDIEISLLLPLTKLLSPLSFLDFMLVVYPALLSVFTLKEPEVVAKPLFTVGLRSSDKGDEGIVKVRESAKTGVEEANENKPEMPKIVDSATIFATLSPKLPLLSLKNDFLPYVFLESVVE